MCSRPQKSECPIGDGCLSKSLVALVGKAIAKRAKNDYGTRTKDFQKCYSNHTVPFRNKSKEKSTTRLETKRKNTMFINNCKAVSQVWTYLCGIENMTFVHRKINYR